MALTDAEILKYRKLTGDTDEQDYSATDDEIDAYYDQAVVDAGTATGTIEARTVIYLLRQRMGWAINQTDETGEFGNRRNSQIYVNIRDKLLPYWEALAGINTDTAATITSGAWSLGIDAVEDVS